MATKKDQKSKPSNVNESKKKKSSSSTALRVAGGVLAGAAAGALAGVLLAPDSGKNTRNKIADKTKKTALGAKKKITNKVNEVKDKVKKKIGKDAKVKKK